MYYYYLENFNKNKYIQYGNSIFKLDTLDEIIIFLEEENPEI